jgi:Cu2+-exporting ATPase
VAARPAFTLEGHWASEADGRGHVVFNAEGIRCANCASSIQAGVGALPGVLSTDVNVVNGRVSVGWQTGRTSLGAILGKVAELGFRPVPLVGDAAASERRIERRQTMKRIGLAGLGSVQIMMYASGLYTGAFQGIDPVIAEFLKLTCLLIATPVLFYSGAPILRGALLDIQRRTLGMDVTVSLALLLAYFASAFNTLRGTGEVYFDSVTMFIFLLLLGRYFEMKGRHQAASATDALARALPASVNRMLPDGVGTELVPLAAVQVGDRLLIASGQVVPVDGRVAAGEARVDEALVTGESVAQYRGVGEPLLGGSLNVGGAATIEVTSAPHDSTLHSLVRLLERAQSERPRLGRAAERMASWFIVRILLLTALVGIVWLFIEPSRAFPAVLAVLVATCPCALSLATPVAIASATSRLARLGILVTRSDAVEGLAHVDTVMLDKTGTLTAGNARVIETRTDDSIASGPALAIAAALEATSRHPVADAFRSHARNDVVCLDAHEVAAAGIEGSVGGHRWRIGEPTFAAGLGADAQQAIADFVARQGEPGIALGDAAGLHAAFVVSDELRAESRDTVQALRGLGLAVRLASGDRPGPVAHVARELGITEHDARLRPEDKLAVLRRLQQAGRKVLMIGDGINDGPVLAAADVSLAMGHGSSIAHAAGDLVLLRDSLGTLPESIRVARRTLTVIRQNLRWAAGYNLAAVPLAALGLMPPWIAAIGMSVSSLVVVMNARRIAGSGDHDGSPPATFRNDASESNLGDGRNLLNPGT